jgi:hypothetical protein
MRIRMCTGSGDRVAAERSLNASRSRRVTRTPVIKDEAEGHPPTKNPPTSKAIVWVIHETLVLGALSL